MRALLALACLAAAAVAQAAYPVAPRVSVSGDEVTLADLVPGAPEGWGEVALGRAPRPGGERVLSGAWVLQRARQVEAEALLDVPDEVVLARPGSEVGRDEVVREVERVLAVALRPGEQGRITSVSLPGPVPEGAREVRARAPEGTLPSPATVWADVLVDGRRVARAWARVEIFRGRPVLVTARDLRRGQVLGPGDVEVRAAAGDGDVLTEPGQALGRRAVRDLPAGTPVVARHLESVPVMARGDTVRLVARIGGVVASTLGRALEPAGIGDTVRVENVASGRSLAGVVRDGGVVDVTR